MADYQEEFPAFPPADMPELAPGFKDVSWHNDVCPFFMLGERIGLWINYADPAQREGGSRFAVERLDAGGQHVGDMLYTGESLPDALTTIAARRYADILAEWLKPWEWAEMASRNAARGPDDVGCAAHDFCDANMAALDAFQGVYGREGDPGADADAALFAAFLEAARPYLSQPLPDSETQPAVDAATADSENQPAVDAAAVYVLTSACSSWLDEDSTLSACVGVFLSMDDAKAAAFEHSAHDGADAPSVEWQDVHAKHAEGVAGEWRYRVEARVIGKGI